MRKESNRHRGTQKLLDITGLVQDRKLIRCVCACVVTDRISTLSSTIKSTMRPSSLMNIRMSSPLTTPPSLYFQSGGPSQKARDSIPHPPSLDTRKSMTPKHILILPPFPSTAPQCNRIKSKKPQADTLSPSTAAAKKSSSTSAAKTQPKPSKTSATATKPAPSSTA